jgi:biopolymer transport protein ExbB/TolQ
VNGITFLLYTQDLNSQTLLFGYFQYFYILFMFMFLPLLLWPIIFFKYIFLTILNLKIYLLTCKQFVEVFHCVLHPVKAIKSEQLAVFSFANVGNSV